MIGRSPSLVVKEMHVNRPHPGEVPLLPCEKANVRTPGELPTPNAGDDVEQLEVPGAPARLEDHAATQGNALALSEADSLSGLNPAFQGG